MEKQWAGTTYGNGWMHKWLIRMLKVIDMRAIYAFVAVFVIPVCLVVNPAQKIIYRYFRQRWGMSPLRAALKTYRNFYLFGQVVVDRFAVYAGKTFEINVEGMDHFNALEQRPDGFVQLSAHVGNYEMAGYTLTADKPLNALVFGGEKESVMANRNRMFASTHIRMISVRPDMGHLFEINNALANGETVSMPADRLFGSKKSIRLPFLGKDADFPAGPFSLATMRGVDVIAVNVMKKSARAYQIYVTPLHYDRTLPRQQQTHQLAQAYVSELERIVTLYPEQWYNYYEFWT